MLLDNLFFTALTRNEDDAGTSSTLNMTINIDGDDVLDQDFETDMDRAEARLLGGETLSTPFDTIGLTNSSIRLGIRGDNAWAPEHILLFGQLRPDFEPGRLVALAMETDLTHWLSTDSSEGHLTMPVRLVSSGSSTTLIRRVLLLVRTFWGSGLWGSGTGTDSRVELEIVADGNVVVKQVIPDTPQPDLEADRENWYFLDVAVPFTRGDVLANGRVRLSILDEDPWLPETILVFGLDTHTGRPDEVVTLVAVFPVQPIGWLDIHGGPGRFPFVDLPVESV
jgi:hypothetical protein